MPVKKPTVVRYEKQKKKKKKKELGKNSVGR